MKTKDRNDDEIILEGFRSLRINKGRYINPYDLGTNEYNLFERGWTQAIKRISNEDLKELEKQREAQGSPNEKQGKLVEKKNAYANRKGQNDKPPNI